VEKEVNAMPRTLRKNRFTCLSVFFLVLAISGCVVLLGSNVMAASIMKIGMKEEPKTLNIWLASDRWSLRVLSLIYQPLYYRDPETLERVPWLAEEKSPQEIRLLEVYREDRDTGQEDGQVLSETANGRFFGKDVDHTHRTKERVGRGGGGGQR
jgi:ABC-type transport system substrate-binding protein